MSRKLSCAAVARRCTWFVVPLVLACAGCKSSPPQNPFAERDRADQAQRQQVANQTSPGEDGESVADSAAEALAAEGAALSQAAGDSAKKAHNASSQRRARAWC